MKNLTEKEAREVGVTKDLSERRSHVEECRKKITDKDYIDDAIFKIASDLSHYLTK